jgi:hypothetical protein
MINDNISEYVHLTFAALFFLLLSFNSYFLFTKHGKKITEIKLIKNKIYKACGIIMLLSIVCIAVYIWLLKDTFITQLKPVLVFESIALCAFGISWLVKGQR